MDDIEIIDSFKIVEKLNNFPVDISPKLASKILSLNNNYSEYINNVSFLLQNKPLMKNLKLAPKRNQELRL